ncbi:MAG: RNA methyltransferase [Pelagibacteraceae bacterium]|nr:RNA methyltransferase [Pelagibacteraceae bacterium]|tara:strand:- start:65 stop:763 length:699 start_codon:yes stop_codon:yes gene_type:complete
MSNIRLFFHESLSLNLKSKLDKTQSHYISKVMRMSNGQNFVLFNQSGEWKAKVDNINKGILEFSIVKKLRSSENEKEIWLAFAPIKLNYLNLMIQKATELGVTRFIPILTERTIVRRLNEKRINKIIKEACEQSNRLNIPKLDKIIKLDNFLKSNQNINVIFGDLNSDSKKLDIIKKDPICILIGPEGDFSIKERENIYKQKNIFPFNINKNILRSETAAISMISIVSFNLL